MSAVSSRFLIAPEAAIQKFLVDMRLAAERSYPSWKQALESGFAKTSLAPADRQALLNPHPLEDYFYAGLIGLQAAAARECFTPAVAEALLRQVALQVDAAAGRGDRIVSNMVFIIFGRIRKNSDLGLPAAPHDVVTDVILERVAIDRMAATRHLMHSPRYRESLNTPLVARALWWDAFRALYIVNTTTQPHARRTRAAAREAFMARRIPSATVFESYAPAPSPPLPALALKLGKWLTPRPHLN
jgi:hypothetical protein